MAPSKTIPSVARLSVAADRPLPRGGDAARCLVDGWQNPHGSTSATSTLASSVRRVLFLEQTFKNIPWINACALRAIVVAFSFLLLVEVGLSESDVRGEMSAGAGKSANGARKSQERRTDKPPAEEGNSSKARLTEIRYTSSESYTRITMGLSTEVRYEAHTLKEDATKGLPPRIYVDVLGARLAMDARRPILVQDSLLRQVRAGQFGPDVVRVVLDLNSLAGYKAFLLPDPYRLVIDIQGQGSGTQLASVEKTTTEPAAREPKPIPMSGIHKIVLDPGHGGKDPGAIGVGGIAEKDIVLKVAKKLAERLKKELGIEVVLTRHDDTFIPLEDRTAIANAQRADLFVSLHINASPNPDAKGLETYYLDNTNDEGSIRLAARENGTSRKSISDLQFILSDLTQNLKLEDSITLAHQLQSSIVSEIGAKYGEVKDLGVKKALFYVLVGARMPSVLVEMFFITNKAEGSSLARRGYRDTLVDALFEGIKKYQASSAVVKNL